MARVSRRDDPCTSMRYAVWASRSQMESAMVGSPMSSCHAFTGTWQVISVEPRSVRSSGTSSRSWRSALVRAARPQSWIYVELHINRLMVSTQ